MLDPELGWTAEPPGMVGAGHCVVERKVSWEKWVGPIGGRMGSGERRTRMTPKQRFEFPVHQVWSLLVCANFREF